MKDMNPQEFNYEGMCLFLDVEDKDLQQRNRAVVMANLIETTLTEGKVPKKTLGLIVGYFNQIPEKLRGALNQELKTQLANRGLVNVE